ncbi:ADP-ribosylation factor-like protein 4A [Palaemon carinicauda]|uniref:ADP-ribosylation factor-like protein 4A n=1 Tax=Palaemon carinicauda TaxID=392227 RepID=UPI0035B5F574
MVRLQTLKELTSLSRTRTPSTDHQAEKLPIRPQQPVLITTLGTSFLIWDVGGQEKIRPLWRSYTRCTDGIVFVVDSVDMERLEEARCELHKTARLPENTQVPILVLANKQDLPGAREPTEIERLLGLAELANTHLWHIQPACAITGEGLDEALENLYEMIHKQRRISKTNKKKPR